MYLIPAQLRQQTTHESIIQGHQSFKTVLIVTTARHQYASALEGMVCPRWSMLTASEFRPSGSQLRLSPLLERVRAHLDKVDTTAITQGSLSHVCTSMSRRIPLSIMGSQL